GSEATRLTFDFVNQLHPAWRPMPLTLSIGNASATEGNSGTATASFSVSLSNASASTTTVDYTTNDATATAPTDYTAAGGTLTFAPGQTSKTINVSVKGDTTFEPDETFTVQLSNPSGATIADSSGLGTITNDDAAPSVAIGNASATE